jgi:hypothetical protein
MAKKKLKEKSQVNGALEGKSVFELMGKKAFPYDQTTLETYHSFLEEMDFADLQRHAVQIANILPNVDKRDRLVDKLEREFIKKLYAYVGYPVQGLTPEPSSDIAKILSRGK